ncbi:hypothetical protein, partial [Staphylococcus aureus]|uniref:hypothetical protein n=1 Tax=Staphylococcus aureus TaxID=1280 RepID=UPI001C834478
MMKRHKNTGISNYLPNTRYFEGNQIVHFRYGRPKRKQQELSKVLYKFKYIKRKVILQLNKEWKQHE